MHGRSVTRRGFVTLVAAAATSVAAGRPAFAAEEATGALVGRLTDSTGSPLTEAAVVVESVANPATYSYAGTDGDGRYRLELVPGQYTVAFEHNSRLQWIPQAVDRDAASVFTVTAFVDTVADDVKVPSGSISGTVTFTDGTPATGFTVWLMNGPDRGFLPTNSDGTYRFADVAPGTYQVLFMGEDGFEQWAYGAVDAEHATVFTVTRGQNTLIDDTMLPARSA
jgi:hypothetical protein